MNTWTKDSVPTPSAAGLYDFSICFPSRPPLPRFVTQWTVCMHFFKWLARALSELHLAHSPSDPAIAVALLDVFAWVGVGNPEHLKGWHTWFPVYGLAWTQRWDLRKLSNHTHPGPEREVQLLEHLSPFPLLYFCCIPKYIGFHVYHHTGKRPQPIKFQ